MNGYGSMRRGDSFTRTSSQEHVPENKPYQYPERRRELIENVKRFGNVDLSSLPLLKKSSRRRYKAGDRVMYLGGDSQVTCGFDNAQSLNTPATILSSSYGEHEYYQLKFDKNLPVGNRCGKDRQTIYRSNLRPLEVSLSAKLQFHLSSEEMLFAAPDGKTYRLDPILVSDYHFHNRKTRLMYGRYGDRVFHDCNGVEVHVGDVALVSGYAYSDYPWRNSDCNVPVLVVHIGYNSSYVFPYVLMANAARQPMARHSRPNGFSTLHERYRKDDKLIRLNLTSQSKLTVLKALPVKPMLEEKDIPKVGQKVRLRVGANPRFLAGNVKPTSRGVLVEILDDNIAVVDFKHFKGWKCDLSDLQVQRRKSSKKKASIKAAA